MAQMKPQPIYIRAPLGPLRMLHIGRKLPKKLERDGWREVDGAMHMGQGFWIIPLGKLRP